MLRFSLLAFSMVFSVSSLVIPRTWAKPSPISKPLVVNSSSSKPNVTISKQSSNTYHQGFCYDIYAGKNPIGYILETKTTTNSSDLQHKVYTQITNSKNILEERLETVSDIFYKPKSFAYKSLKNNSLNLEVSAQFKKYPKDYLAEIRIQKPKKKPEYKKISVPEGVVLNSQFLDLIFYKKNARNLSSKTNLVTETFNERSGELETYQSRLDQTPETLSLIHSSDGKEFKTEHTYSGELIKSILSSQNITLSKCKTVNAHLNNALTKNTFKQLFAQKEKDTLKTCCQL